MRIEQEDIRQIWTPDESTTTLVEFTRFEIFEQSGGSQYIVKFVDSSDHDKKYFKEG